MKKRKKLSDLLKKRNVSAYQLSKELGYKDVTTVYKWLYGKGEPNAATMLKLMIILSVSAEEILRIFAEGADQV